MNYKGYNIAVHELGHNVEQVLSLYDVDHTLLAGVPNSAFTEALAFTFQSRDLDLLGVQTKRDQDAKALNDFWGAWEIAGVGLVDVAAWHWFYDHPKASAKELRDAVVKISKDVWDKYYAPVLGGKGETVLLGIYSHMIAYPLYVIDYPVGHMIEAQIEEHLAKAKALGVEFERMAKTGSVSPDLWMKTATGEGVSAAPLLRAAERALH
jgi:oligoendopeptidase F